MNLTIDQNIILLTIAVFNAITAVVGAIAAIISFRTNRTAKQTQRDMAIVEKATNSMKDQLVKATGEAQFAAGKDEARAEGELRAAALAEGQASKA